LNRLEFLMNMLRLTSGGARNFLPDGLSPRLALPFKCFRETRNFVAKRVFSLISLYSDFDEIISSLLLIGCKGNHNRFSTKEECDLSCSSLKTSKTCMFNID
jgi:hypothetical protein